MLQGQTGINARIERLEALAAVEQIALGRKATGRSSRWFSLVQRISYRNWYF